MNAFKKIQNSLNTYKQKLDAKIFTTHVSGLVSPLQLNYLQKCAAMVCFYSYLDFKRHKKLVEQLAGDFSDLQIQKNVLPLRCEY